VGTHTVTASYTDGATLANSTGTLSGGQVVNVKPPPSNATFLAQIYPDLLHRTADPSGLATFGNALAQGMSRNEVALALATSPEYRMNLIESFYNLYLHRTADDSGLTGSLATLNTGGTDEQVQVAITGSPEYFQTRGGGTNDGFLQALYQDALGRPIDSSGQ